MARLISIDSEEQAAIREAVEVLSRARPVAMPTETVYGLAADATNPAAITSIYETKGRPRFNPLISHVSDMAMAERHAVFDPISRLLADRFWPGPLTLILPLREDSSIHELATSGLDTVGLRMPQGFAARLIAAFDRPLAAPSANTSGRISPTSAQHVDEDLGDRLDLILDGGECQVGVESTIVKVEDGQIRLLRPGGIPAEAIEDVTGLPVIRLEKAGAAIEAPGMLASHYAPDRPIRLEATHVEPQEALLTFGGAVVDGSDQAFAVFDLSPSADMAEAATNLFAYMKRADASGAKGIAVVTIPSTGLGEAINDRLARAAAPKE